MATKNPAPTVDADELTPAQAARAAAAQAEKDKALMRNASPSQIQAAGIQNGMTPEDICRRLRAVGVVEG